MTAFPLTQNFVTGTWSVREIEIVREYFDLRRMGTFVDADDFYIATEKALEERRTACRGAHLREPWTKLATQQTYRKFGRRVRDRDSRKSCSLGPSDGLRLKPT